MDITQMDGRTLTLLGSGLCTMASVHFTTQLVSQHLFYWKNPAQQRLIIVIVCMAPVYALTSFFGLAEIKGSEVLFTVLESIKECYEALVSILIAFIGWSVCLSFLSFFLYILSCSGFPVVCSKEINPCPITADSADSCPSSR
jgi:Mn2+/Fe2+ NRAMP family transporter